MTVAYKASTEQLITGVGKMRVSSAIKVRINVKHRIRDRVMFKKVCAGEH